MRRIALISLLALPMWAIAQPAVGQEEPTASEGSENENGNENGNENENENENGNENGNENENENGPDRLSPSSADAPPTDPVKVAVVTVGDPDETLRNRSREVDAVLSRAETLTTPADSGLRRALRGEAAPDEDDGLGRVRRERRSLGIDDADDASGLSALGRVTGSVAVVAVRRRAGTVEATVLDVASGQLYEGELDLAATEDDAILEFVLPRARASSLRAAERERESERRNWRDGAAAEQDGSDAAARQAGDSSASEEDEGEDDEPGFFEKWWPYMVGALLLGGALIYAFTIDTTPDTPPPVLRFIPGGN